MNEYIVWDKKSRKFIDYELINEFEKPSLKDGNVFPYIGKTDQENKKIYAECSVVEFEFLGKPRKGYFVWNESRLRYYIECIGIVKKYAYDYELVRNLKIIGTLQENNYDTKI